MESAPMIEFPCGSCGKLLKAKLEYSGRRCKCTKCNQSNIIPGTRPGQEDQADEVDYRLVQEEIPTEPMVLRNFIRKPGMDLVGVIRGFLQVTAILLTVAVSVLLFILVISIVKDVRLVAGIDRWTMFGYVIGLWFGGMVSLATAYLLSEVVMELRSQHRY